MALVLNPSLFFKGETTMNINEVKDLLKEFDTSSLREFDLREGDFELYMNKNKTSRGTVAAEVAPAPVAMPVAPAPKESEPAESSAPAENKVASGTEIVSPIVGVVYLRPAPDKADFKAVGDTIKKGDVLCIVEAMKVMNEITADLDGVITEILVKNEQVVEFGQPLFRVK